MNGASGHADLVGLPDSLASFSAGLVWADPGEAEAAGGLSRSDLSAQLIRFQRSVGSAFKPSCSLWGAVLLQHAPDPGRVSSQRRWSATRGIGGHHPGVLPDHRRPAALRSSRADVGRSSDPASRRAARRPRQSCSNADWPSPRPQRLVPPDAWRERQPHRDLDGGPDRLGSPGTGEAPRRATDPIGPGREPVGWRGRCTSRSDAAVLLLALPACRGRTMSGHLPARLRPLAAFTASVADRRVGAGTDARRRLAVNQRPSLALRSGTARR